MSLQDLRSESKAPLCAATTHVRPFDWLERFGHEAWTQRPHQGGVHVTILREEGISIKMPQQDRQYSTRNGPCAFIEYAYGAVIPAAAFGTSVRVGLMRRIALVLHARQ